MRELDSEEISEQMAYDLVELREQRRALRQGARDGRLRQPQRLAPPRQSEREMRAHAEAIFGAWPDAVRIG